MADFGSLRYVEMLFKWGRQDRQLNLQPAARRSPELRQSLTSVQFAVSCNSHTEHDYAGRLRLTNCLLCSSLFVKNLRVLMVHGLESPMLADCQCQALQQANHRLPRLVVVEKADAEEKLQSRQQKLSPCRINNLAFSSVSSLPLRSSITVERVCHLIVISSLHNRFSCLLIDWDV